MAILWINYSSEWLSMPENGGGYITVTVNTCSSWMRCLLFVLTWDLPLTPTLYLFLDLSPPVLSLSLHSTSASCSHIPLPPVMAVRNTPNHLPPPLQVMAVAFPATRSLPSNTESNGSVKGSPSLLKIWGRWGDAGLAATAFLCWCWDLTTSVLFQQVFRFFCNPVSTS